MHRSHLQIILLAAAIDPVARHHHMSADQLYECLTTLRPKMNSGMLRYTANLAVRPILADHLR